MARTSEAEKAKAVAKAKVHGFKKTAKEYKVSPVTLYAWSRKMNGHVPEDKKLEKAMKDTWNLLERNKDVPDYIMPHNAVVAINERVLIDLIEKNVKMQLEAAFARLTSSQSGTAPRS
jgi:transposase-like protein